MREKEILLSTRRDEGVKPPGGVSENESKTPEEAHEAQRRAERFLEDESRFLNAYTQEIGLQFEPGEWWATDMKKGIVYYNLEHFGEQEFSRRDGFLFLLHEIDAHLREMALDPETVERLNRRVERDPRIQLLHNVTQDVAGDRKTAARFPVLSDGASSNAARVKRAIERLRESDAIVVRIGMGESAVERSDPYQPDVQAVPDVKNFTETLRKTLEPYIESL